MVFEIKEREDFFDIIVSGSLDAASFEKLFAALFTQDGGTTDSRILYDFTKLIVMHLDPGEMIDIIDLCEMWRNEIGRGQCAFVVPQKEQYHFAHMFMRRAMFKWDVDMEAFPSRQEAFSWLLDDPDLQRMYTEEADVEDSVNQNPDNDEQVTTGYDVTEKVPLTKKDFKLRLRLGKKKSD